MRNMNQFASKTDPDSAYPERVEEAILPSRLTMRQWVKEHADEIIDVAL